jgi:hypothetical protein
MSKFKSVILVDVEAVKTLLPEGHHLNRIVWNPTDNQVEVHWEHDKFRTPVDFEVDFPIDNLEQLSLPDGVTILRPAKAPETQTEPEFPQQESQPTGTIVPLPGVPDGGSAVKEPEFPATTVEVPVADPNPPATEPAVEEKVPEIAVAPLPANPAKKRASVPTAKQKAVAAKKRGK